MHKIAKQDKVFVYFQISQKTHDYSTTSKKCPNPCHALDSQGNDGDGRFISQEICRRKVLCRGDGGVGVRHHLRYIDGG